MPPKPLAPNNAQSGTSKGKRLQALLDFAVSIQTRLTTGPPTPPGDDQLLELLRSHVRSLHATCERPNHPFSGNQELDRLGTAIWNLSTRRMRDVDDKAAARDSTKLPVYARVFAFQLLNAAQHSGKPSLANTVRLMRLALKAGRSSIEASELEMAGFVLQKGADYVAYFGEQRPSIDADDARDVRGLEAEYYILRTALSWKEDRLDVAEHMYNKGTLTDQPLDPHYAEKLADVLFEIGQGMMTKKDFQMAVKWLDRAQDVINKHDLEQHSRDALELRQAIVQALVTALINVGTPEGFSKANHLIVYLESEIGSTMVVSLLKLELLMKAPAEIFDSDTYATILNHMITYLRQKDLSMDVAGQSPGDADFRLIFHHIGKLHSKNPDLGCAVLDEFILAIGKSKQDGWIERLATKRIWMATHREISVESIHAAEAALSHISQPLGAEASVAAQTLMWKSLESAYKQKKFDVAEKWCHLALHRIFEHAGPLNRAKIERKNLLCALSRNDIDGARSIYHSMAEETQKEPRTLYLMYKLALRSDDPEEATRCIERISQASQPMDYLYACCLDAKAAPHKDYALEALTSLLAKNAHSPSSPIHLPALLRCTIRLLVKGVDEQTDQSDGRKAVQELCRVFSEVAIAIQRDPKDSNGKKLFDINELDWFARNAYNLGIKHLEAWDVTDTIDLLTSCNAIMAHFPADISSEVAADIPLKTLFNNFIISSGLVARARSRDNIEDQLQDYLVMRQHVAAFDSSLPLELPAMVEGARADLLSKLACLLTFDFEAALALKSYNDLTQIVRKAAACCSGSAPLSLQAMADCLLRSSSAVPTQAVYSVLRAIINALSSFPEGGMDTVKLSRYMRCLFGVALPFDESLALGLLKEYVDIMKEAVRQNVPPPQEETEWLAATAFNHAVDCYYAKRDADCREWAFLAFGVAHLMSDGGVLEGVLHNKFNQLRFDAA